MLTAIFPQLVTGVIETNVSKGKSAENEQEIGGKSNSKFISYECENDNK